MESLIPIVNQLQDVCNTAEIPLPIDLPQIVVCGLQSSGKSSVIESIVRREFLPRGQDIVTRRPLVIRLTKVKSSSRSGEWVKFNHRDDEFTDFDEVRAEIERETQRVCGEDKGISSEPITLSVYSKNVVDLTLVDLPGLTKVAVGDQPEDIENQLRELILKYIKNPNSIILAVTAANNDFPTSDAIKMAREVDPEGKRTLGVLTKLDIMEQGTDALKVLLGRVIPIRLGIIGVVNRSQEEIRNKKTIQEAIEDEAIFLQKHYPTIAAKNGTPYLAKRLSNLLQHHIRACLPDLEARVNQLITQYEAQLNSFGDPVTDPVTTIINVITRFSLSYCDIIKGGEQQIDTNELCGGARIQWIYDNSFNEALSAINPLETLDRRAILTATRNADSATGICVPDVFRSLVKKQIKRLEDPSLQCVNLVHKEMGHFVRHCSDEVRLELLRFPKLGEKIEDVLRKLLDVRLPVTRDFISNLVGCILARIDPKDPRLRGYMELDAPGSTGGDLAPRSTTVQQNGVNTNGISTPSVMGVGDPRYERELRECDLTARKIQAYFNIVREEIKIFVPRVITHYIVDYIKSNLQSALTKEIIHKGNFEDLLSESDDIARRRKETADHLNVARKASEIINAIRDHKHHSNQ